MKQLEGKVALITGGSRSIGAAIAKGLAEAGAKVALTYKTAENAAAEVVREIESKGGQAKAYRADNADAEDANNIVAQVMQDFGQLDILVNNAGISPTKPLHEVTDADFDEVVHTNVRGVFFTSREAAKVMQEGGRIINIGSVWGERMPLPGVSLYTMSKFAVAGLTRAWARDLGAKGITVNNVQPGPIDTDGNPSSGDFAQVLAPMTALGRYGEPKDIAGMVAFLASSEAKYVTGSSINVDGGFNA